MDLVTGGTGFVGAHLVRALLAKGHAVRCLVRRGTKATNLDGLDVERVEGDLRDSDSLVRAVTGSERVFHCAADYRLGAPDPVTLHQSNVEGTRNVLQAARDAGVSKVVYTSSVGALGLTADGTPANETTPVSRDSVVGAYKRSKFDAERVAEEFARGGLPVVIVNPSTPVGELDVKPTPTGQVIVDFLNRRMPAYVETGMNLVDVRDVAAGHLLAAEKGTPGEKYILGNRDMTLKEILDALGTISGLPSPRVKLPHAVPYVFAALDTAFSRVLGKAPRVSIESVRMSRHLMFFDASKARRELGFAPGPVEAALERAVEWFRANGYVRH
ncbi:MAG TPA: hopanoid-associated sugar epimerase [Thermoanaerobaculia bacterium]|nr:hopanoid-associated sugar epimerase [Thermoanaerobaculia bacterium]